MLLKLLDRLVAWLHRRNLEREVDQELQFHVEMQARENIARGMSTEEARRAALVSLGGVSQVHERVRDQRATWLDSLAQDLRYAVRLYARHPASTAVGIIVLALGIGINTALFSVINAFLFRPLAGVKSPAELRYVYSQNLEDLQPQQASGISYNEYLRLRERTDLFSSLLARGADGGVLRIDGQATPVTGEVVSANYFDVLGVRPMAGRVFTPADEARDATPTIVISHGLWKSRFNGETGTLGRVIHLDIRVGSGMGHASSDLRAYTIVGIIGEAFKGTISAWESSDFWVPVIARAPDVEMTWPRYLSMGFLGVIGRLKPGVTEAQAESVLTPAHREWLDARMPSDSHMSVVMLVRDSPSVRRLPFDTSWRVVPWRLAAALMAVAGMVLLIAAANLAGVIMARGIVRRGEIAVRLALGAGQRRVGRQLLTETILLSLAGGACSIPVARLLVNLFIVSTPAQFGGKYSRLANVSLDVPLDLHVLAFTIAVCVVAGIAIGVAPARQASKTDLMTALSGSAAAGSKPVRSRLRYWIVVPQVCLSLALLVAAGVFVRTLLRAEATDHGYNVEHVAMVEYQLPIISRAAIYQPTGDNATAREAWKSITARRMTFAREMLTRSAALPGVVATTLALHLPWEGVRFSCSVIAQKDYAHPWGANRWIERADASPAYFDTLGMRILRGRAFDDRDRTSGRPVAIVSESLARMLWPGKDAIGEYLAEFDPKSTYQQAPKWREVVGIARETTAALADGPSRPFVYFPPEERNFDSTLVARGLGDPAALLRNLSNAVRQSDSEALVLGARTGTESIDEVLYARRMAAAILLICGLAGLFLATVGIYGVVSYSVAQRIREIGIRTTLGAAKSDILRLVIGEGMRVVVIGTIAGLALALAATRIASSFVVDIPAIDALTFVAVPLFLAAVILLACYIPARRAARVDPMVALREL